MVAVSPQALQRGAREGAECVFQMTPIHYHHRQKDRRRERLVKQPGERRVKIQTTVEIFEIEMIRN